MGYAPSTKVVTAPSPALTGTSLVVEEGWGDVFPDAPFVALVWTNGELPDLGVNAEQPTVTAKDADTFTITRGSLPFAIAAAHRIALLRKQTVFGLGDVVTLSDTHSGTAPYTIHLRDPDGYHFERTAGAAPAFSGSAGADALTKQGQYAYAFSDVNGRRTADQDFFIRFTPVV